jgi:hypothetical protein
MAVYPSEFSSFTDRFRPRSSERDEFDADMTSWAGEKPDLRQSKAYQGGATQRMDAFDTGFWGSGAQGVIAGDGASTLFGAPMRQNQAISDYASSSLENLGAVRAARRESDAQVNAANRQARSQTTGAVIGAVGGVAAAAVGALI